MQAMQAGFVTPPVLGVFLLGCFFEVTQPLRATSVKLFSDFTIIVDSTITYLLSDMPVEFSELLW